MSLIPMKDQDSPYHDNLNAVLDLILHNRQNPRACTIIHELRHRILLRSQDPEAAIDPVSVMRADTCPNLIVKQKEAQRSNPLNESISYIEKESRAKSNKTQTTFAKQSASIQVYHEEKINYGKREVDQTEDVRKTKQMKLDQACNKLQDFVAGALDRFRECNNTMQSDQNENIRSQDRVVDLFTSEATFFKLSGDTIDVINHAPETAAIFITIVLSDGSPHTQVALKKASTPAAILLLVVEEGVPVRSLYVFLHEDHKSNVLSLFYSLLETKAVKVSYDFKFIFRCFLKFSSDMHQPAYINTTFFDTKLAAWIRFPDSQPEALLFTSISSQLILADGTKKNLNSSFCNVFHPKTRFGEVQYRNCGELKMQFESLSEIIVSLDRRLLESLYIESRLSLVLATMEQDGVELNVGCLESQRSAIVQRLAVLEAKCCEIAGHDFNLASPEQVARVVFDELKLPSSITLESGRRSTAESALLELKKYHPLPGLISEHRALSKLLHTYIGPLICASLQTPGVVHTTWNQTACATGRLSSSGPNLQAIPRVNRFEMSCEFDTSECRIGNIRNAFCCSKTYRLIAADYRQMEVRVLAFLSGDVDLLNAITDVHDVYKVLAGAIFSKPIDLVSSQERSQAKTVFLAIIYGMGPAALRKELSSLTHDVCPLEKAKKMMEDLFSRFPRIQQFILKVIESCREQQFVETITGRRRYLPDIISDDDVRRRQAERQAVNTIIQGSSSDVMKYAMLSLAEELRHDNFRSRVRIRLQLHDELVISCPEACLRSLCEIVRSSMQNNTLLKRHRIPLQVSIKTGQTLGALRPYSESVSTLLPESTGLERISGATSAHSPASETDVVFVMEELSEKFNKFKHQASKSESKFNNI
uniref:DNA-directed DNA polymerase n=1 Tax=Spongospora subterranea TaxID=70186 RepID=A0A0H5QT77_9EUKA|eukprot:CRZ04907.1 hypothetical protein [Spongospora subterranea]